MAMAEQQIEHIHLAVRGLNLHVAQVGTGELGTVLFLHGFPEIWYSWRHQMLAVAAAGYRAIAPDWRGYGLSDQPPEPDAAVHRELDEDLLAILDALSVPKVPSIIGHFWGNQCARIRGGVSIYRSVSAPLMYRMSAAPRIKHALLAYLVAKDFGTMPAYDFALRHPNRTCGVMCLGVPFLHGGSSYTAMPEGFYILRWREPGRAEADFGRYGVKRVVRTIYILFSRSDIPTAKEDQEIMDLADLTTPLPEWFTEEDLAVYASLYEKSGFAYPLQMTYRSLHKRQPIEDPKFEVPVSVVMGEKDYLCKFPGVKAVLKNGTMEKFAPDLKITYIPEGSHFIQEQFPDKVNELLVGFLKDHPVA